MKSFLSFSFCLLVSGLFFLTGCEDDRCVRTEEYIEYQPVYKTLDEMRVPVSFTDAKTMQAPGKIYYYKGYLLVNELHEGIHVIDNSDPANPVKKGFLEIPGNIDMAINGDILYVDNYLDLVAIDLTNPLAPTEVARVNDVFQTFYSYSEQLGYLVEYVPTDVRRQLDCSDNNWGQPIWFTGELMLANVDAFARFESLSNSSSVPSSVVIGGSMARFTAFNDHLYTIDGSEVKVFNVSSTQPELKNEVAMQWGIETLFPMAGNLFVGSVSGLLIYDISNPEAPEYRSTFSHATSCDPVFVSGDVAYVTLRNGSACQGFVNQLDVINVSNLWNPKLIKSYPMDNPHGLSVVENTLYLCEGAFGLKVFDVENKNRIDDNLKDHVRNFFAYDVIVLPPGNLVMVIGQDGLYQFDATDRDDLKQLSLIAIGQ